MKVELEIIVMHDGHGDITDVATFSTSEAALSFLSEQIGETLTTLAEFQAWCEKQRAADTDHYAWFHDGLDVQTPPLGA